MLSRVFIFFLKIVCSGTGIVQQMRKNITCQSADRSVNFRTMDSEVGSLQTQEEKDEQYRRELTQLFKDLRSQAISNIDYYQDDKSNNGKRFHSAFCYLVEYLRADSEIEHAIVEILGVAREYDFNHIPANGYRSTVKLIDMCCRHIELLARYITVNRASYFFRTSHYSMELEAYVSCLGQLKICVCYLQKLLMYSNEGELFADEKKMKDPVAEQLLTEMEYSINQEAFYGRTLGFQFCESMKKSLETVVTIMAGYSQAYEIPGGYRKLATSLFNTGRYYWNPEQRAHQLIKTTRDADIKFCKSFWMLGDSEIVQNLPMLVCPKVAVDIAFTIPPDPVNLDRTDGLGKVTIQPPSSHGKVGHVNARLISYEYRKGQETLVAQGKEPIKQSERSPYLLIHCHGGGWVAQSSKTHEVYLRHWAQGLNAPIFCVDYSLAPEYTYPRAFEECFFAYAWAVKNCKALGSTGEVICMVGDSAGANLMMTTALKVGSEGIRPPDGIVSVYCVMITGFDPSASRLLTAIDPLMPIGILARCVAGYVGIDEKDAKLPPILESPLSPSRSNPGNVFFGFDNPANVTNSSQQDCCDSIQNAIIVQRKVDKDNKSELTKEENNMKLKTFASNITQPDTLINAMNTNNERTMNDEKLPGFVVIANDDGNVVTECTESVKLINLVTDNTDTGDVQLSQGISQSQNSSKKTEHDIGIDGKEQVLKTAAVSQRHRTISVGAKISAVDLHGTEHSLVKSHQHHLLTHHRSPSVPTFSSNFFHHKDFLQLPVYTHSQNLDVTDQPLRNPLYVLRHIEIPRDPYLSPLLATDDMLEELPMVYLVTTHMDPLLDDSLTFAKRLQALRKPVHVDVIDGLMHGFLNFSLVSPEAKKASELCMNRVMDVFKKNYRHKE